MNHLIAPSVNLALLIGILVFKLRIPMRNFVFQRHQSIAREIELVSGKLLQARQKYEELNRKLNSIEVEIRTLRAEITQDAATARDRIVSEANRLASEVGRDSKQSVSGLYSELRILLYREFSGRVLDHSESLLRERLTDEDRKRIRREFSTQMEILR
jgi:F0F1-type ATP synthase membrane subunit b/b'